MSLELEEAFRMILKVSRVFERLGIPYVTVGSIASSIHGIPRTTEDVDLVAPLEPSHVGPLVEALQKEFYVDGERIHSAIRRGSSFNLIHLGTLVKIDVFVPEKSVARLEISRRRPVSLEGPDGEEVVLQMASPEDVVLQKLVWYRRGNEVSERQWRDALGVLKVQGRRLDLDYLRQGARRLGVEDLLQRALKPPSPPTEESPG